MVSNGPTEAVNNLIGIRGSPWTPPNTAPTADRLLWSARRGGHERWRPWPASMLMP
jgi:hypothetical protein